MEVKISPTIIKKPKRQISEDRKSMNVKHKKNSIKEWPNNLNKKELNGPQKIKKMKSFKQKWQLSWQIKDLRVRNRMQNCWKKKRKLWLSLRKLRKMDGVNKYDVITTNLL